MFQLAINFLYAFLACGHYGIHANDVCPRMSTHKEVCLVELDPVLQYISNNHKNHWNSANAIQINVTRKQLTKIEGQEKEINDKLKVIQEKMDSEFNALKAKTKNVKNIQRDLASLELQLQETRIALNLSVEAKKVMPKVEIPTNFQKIGWRHFFIENKHKVNWFEATSKCHKMGGHLLTIQSGEELGAIRTELEVIQEKNPDFWLDINDIAKWGEFVSLTTGGNPPFFKWQKLRPQVKIHQRCVYLHGGEMMDGKCSEHFFFICQLAVH
ncbi:accessory gland protein Acp29AB [Drosophila teissieri]|uniref:accessory gland protein Acp29AB n=1 Tax=Drosophila teissieri TaxID=7243 RepID=UPI001CBA59D5|nr:accessory gland protein Acp29AB [Drosophila teissieri]